MPRFKGGVVMYDMHPAIECKLYMLDRLTRKYVNRDALITSAREGVHSANSLHYQGRAIDLRTRDIPADKWTEYTRDIQRALGDGYDVVLEGTHLHIEWQPE